MIFNEGEAWTWSEVDNSKGKGVVEDEPERDSQSTPTEQQQ